MFLLRSKTMYFYIHGFNSGINSSSVENLRKYISGIIPLEWDCSVECETNISSLIEQIRSHVNDEDFEDVTIIGSSMGGYYARRIADMISDDYNVSCVLFNPVTSPSEQIRQFVGHNVNYATGKSYEFTEEILSSYRDIEVVNKNIPSIVFVSDCDEVLPNNVERVESKYHDSSLIRVIHTAHRIDDYEEYVDGIRSVHGAISYISD